MSIPAWEVINWAPVQMSLQDFQRSRGSFRHLSTSVQVDGDADKPRAGQTLWAMDSSSGPLGMAFEWTEMQEEVIVLGDPMHILTNLQLVEDDGTDVDESMELVHLNSIIHELNWQDRIPPRTRRVSLALNAC